MTRTSRRAFLLGASACLAVSSARANPPADPASTLFDSPRIEDFKLTFHPNDWAALKLQTGMGENTYYPCRFEWRGMVIDDVGARNRGRGSRSSVKPGLRVDFNRYEDHSLLGLSALVFDNMTQDPPMLREYLSMQLYRAAGLPAPREVYTRLLVNGEPMGLFLATEDIGKPYLQRHFAETSGDLFEYDWAFPWHWETRGDAGDAYVPVPLKPKTHESRPNAEAVLDLIRAINRSNPDNFAEQVGRRLDLDNLWTYAAVECFVSETDGITGYVGTNNFYLYRASSDGLFRFLPWDKDSTFAYYECPLLTSTADNLLFRASMGNPELRGRYAGEVRRVSELAGGEGGWLQRLAQRQFEFIQSEALADAKKPYTNEEFLQSAQDLFFFIGERYYQIGLQWGDLCAEACFVENPA